MLSVDEKGVSLNDLSEDMRIELDNIYGLRQKNTAKIDERADYRVFDWAEYINSG